MLFKDRKDAGQALATLVAALPDLENAVVLALPRGGVPVAFEVARALRLPLDILVVRKLRAPGQPELALGAIASGGIVVANPEILRALHISERALRALAQREMPELESCERRYRGRTLPLNVEGRTVVLVDDGLATGATMRSAARAVRPQARRVILAVPVAARSTLVELAAEADEILCVFAPDSFEAVGQHYRNFEPTSDDEVRGLLNEARGWLPQ